MSQLARWTIFAGKPWRIGRRAADGVQCFDLAAEDAGAAADESERLLRENGYGGEGVMLALPSTACLAVALPADAEVDSSNQQALAYAVEPYLPLAAEEVTVAMDARRLSVAVTTSTVAPWIESLEARGIVVQSVSPAALIAVEQIAAELANEPGVTVLWQVGETLERFSLAEGGVTGWSHLPAEPGAAARCLGMSSLGGFGPSRVILVNLSENLWPEVAALPGVEIAAEHAIDLFQAAVAVAERALNGEGPSVIELRTGPLAAKDQYRLVRGPLRFAAICAALLLVGAAAAMLVRGHRYQAEADRLHARQESLFRAALPGQPIPPGLLSRMRSELGKLTVSRGNASAGAQTSPSALVAMRRLLAALPKDVRYRFSEIRLDAGQLQIDGETLSHGDADRLAGCLRQAGFDVAPPRSQQRADQLVGVHWSATIMASTPSAQGKLR